MRHIHLVALLFLATACVADGDPESTGGGTSGTPTRGPASMVGGALTADVLPFAAPPTNFSTSQRGAVTVRLEPQENGTAMWITGDGLSPRRLDWRREGDSIYCSDGPDRAVEFMRIGALPGATWESSGRTLRFDGWERVETPAGSFDAVRISSTLEVDPYSEIETWWFAPGHGLVQMRVDKGELYSLEMKRVP